MDLFVKVKPKYSQMLNQHVGAVTRTCSVGGCRHLLSGSMNIRLHVSPQVVYLCIYRSAPLSRRIWITLEDVLFYWVHEGIAALPENVLPQPLTQKICLLVGGWH